MIYKFKYKSQFERNKLSRLSNKILSNLLFILFSSWPLKKLKSYKNNILISHRLHKKRKNNPKIYKSLIPENPNLNIYSFTFLDCIEIEDSRKLKNRLIKIVSRYKGGFLSDEPSKKLNKAFDKFDSSYKTTSWGTIFYNNTINNEELDLIDGISYGYIKGSQSNFVITYTVYPSAKFQSLFKESLSCPITEESEIIFKSFKHIIKTKKLFSSIRFHIKQPGYWTEKLINEITFQFQSKVVSSLKLGVFNKNNTALFPRITAFEYEPNEFAQYKLELFYKLNTRIEDQYYSSDIILTLNNADYSKSPSNGIELFFPFKSKEEKTEDPFDHISNLSENYINAIAPFWLLINVSALNKQNIINLRKKTFVYIRKNRITLFLKKAIKLKNKISLDWISFERVRKDFTTDIFKNNLELEGLPDALNHPSLNVAFHAEFKKSLIEFSESTSKDIKETYEELLALFSHISEDNSSRANMRLQKYLLWFAIFGVILALYGANSSWVNSWIEHCLNHWGIEIPRVK